MKSLAVVFALLLTIGTFAATRALGDPTRPTPTPNATLDCWNGNSDVSLQMNIRNQGPDDIPAGSVISYTYKTSTSARMPSKKGTYKLDSVLKSGGVRAFNVTPLQNWTPGITQCTAKVK